MGVAALLTVLPICIAEGQEALRDTQVVHEAVASSLVQEDGFEEPATGSPMELVEEATEEATAEAVDSLENGEVQADIERVMRSSPWWRQPTQSRTRTRCTASCSRCSSMSQPARYRCRRSSSPRKTTCFQGSLSSSANKLSCMPSPLPSNRCTSSVGSCRRRCRSRSCKHSCIVPIPASQIWRQ